MTDQWAQSVRLNSIVGKTVARVEVQEWAGRDTFKDMVTWELTVITFTDGSTTSFASWDGEVYDAFQCDYDDEGQPIPLGGKEV